MPALKERVPDRLKSRVKIARAEWSRRVGSTRYSYPAINKLDVQMLDRLPERGTFLEIGANDGYSQSNTYFLEKERHWDGILVEPLPSQFDLCRRHRTRSAVFNTACVGPDGPSTLKLVDRNLMAVGVGLLDSAEEAERTGTGFGEIEVPTAQLSDLIDQSPLSSITFMSIDVEGAELHVLAGLDLERHTPDWLLIETAQPDNVDRVLAGHMTRIDRLSHHDHLYAKVAE
jgi:FkbM family methyltransferase